MQRGALGDVELTPTAGSMRELPDFHVKKNENKRSPEGLVLQVFRCVRTARSPLVFLQSDRLQELCCRTRQKKHTIA